MSHHERVKLVMSPLQKCCLANWKERIICCGHSGVLLDQPNLFSQRVYTSRGDVVSKKRGFDGFFNRNSAVFTTQPSRQREVFRREKNKQRTTGRTIAGRDCFRRSAMLFSLVKHDVSLLLNRRSDRRDRVVSNRGTLSHAARRAATRYNSDNNLSRRNLGREIPRGPLPQRRLRALDSAPSPLLAGNSATLS